MIKKPKKVMKACNYNEHFKARDCKSKPVWRRSTIMGPQQLCPLHCLIDVLIDSGLIAKEIDLVMKQLGAILKRKRK